MQTVRRYFIHADGAGRPGIVLQRDQGAAGLRVMRSFLCGIAVPIMAGIMTADAQSPVFTETPLFVSGENGYHTYRIPAIAKSINGDLLAFCEARKNSSGDSGDIDIVLRRSTDNGQTWGPMKLVQEEGGTAPVSIGNPAPVVDETTGRIFLFFCRNSDRVFYSSSSDHGGTWSGRTEITSSVKLPTWGWYATGPGHGIQIKRGNQAGRLIVPCDHRIGLPGADAGFPGTQVVYSDDHGLSWQLGAVASSTPEVFPNENLCVELVTPAPDGGSHLYFNARKLGFAGSAPGMRVDTNSTNGGQTYSRPYAPRVDLVCPLFNGGVQGSLQRLRATDEGSPTNRILFSCPNDPAYRLRLSIWTSTDEGLTWSAPKPVHEGPSAYSDMARLDNGEIAVLYEKGEISPYETVTFARFNEAWLDEPEPAGPVEEDPKPSLWNFEEKNSGQFADISAGAIRDIHPANHKLNLTSSREFAYVRGSADYGSGTAMAFDGSGGAQISDAESANHFDYSASDSFTLEVVFRVAAGSPQIGALVAKDLDSRLPSWWLRVNNGRLQFLISEYGQQVVVYPPNPVNDGQWHHVAAIRDASNPSSKVLRLYLDGSLIGSVADTTMGTLANAEPLNIGRFGRSDNRNLTGDIDVVRITPAVLAPADFLKSHTQFEGLIAVSQDGKLTDGASNVFFGTTNAGSQGTAKTFTVGNPGTADLTGLTVSIDGPNAADFTVDAHSQTTIAAGTSGAATFTVKFAPGQGSNLRSAVLRVSSNEIGTQNPFDILLGGAANNPPQDISLNNTTLWENVPANTSVGVLSSTDPDVGEVFTYALASGTGSADNADFTITNSHLKIKNRPVLTQKTSYALRIRSTDSGGLFVERPFVLTVTPAGVSYAAWTGDGRLRGEMSLPHAIPFDDGVPNLIKYAFNMNGAGPDCGILPVNGDSGLPRTEVDSTGGHPVFRLEYLRRKGGGLIYSPERSNNLTEFEPMTGKETITSMDSHWERVKIEIPLHPPVTPSAFFRVKVGSIYPAPANLTLSNTSIGDNLPPGSAVSRLITTDPDASRVFTYLLVENAGDSDNSAFSIHADTLKIIDPADFETKSNYAVVIRSTDEYGMFLERTFAISVIKGVESFAGWAANAGLRDADASPEVQPRGDGVPNLLKYAFNMNGGGTDRRILSENGITGLPRTDIATIDGKTTAKIEFLRRRGSRLMYTAQRSNNLIDFEPVNESGVVTPIDSNWERVRFEVPLLPQNETSVFFRVQVSQLNSAPINLALNVTSVSDGLPPDTTVGTFTTVDPDNESIYSYSLVNGEGGSDNAYFSILGDTLKINSLTDFETKSGYSIRVRSTDADGMFAERTFPIAGIAGVVTFPDWVTGVGLGALNAFPNADPYGDGVPNLLKYAFNMNGGGADRTMLMQNGSSGLPRTEMGASGGQAAVRFEYVRKKGSGLAYAAQQSRNLIGFEPMNEMETVSSIDSHWERVIIVKPFRPLSESRSFFRVLVKQQ